jgi:GTPase SAR1 family protein
MIPGYYKDANGIIFMFDITNRASYSSISTWINHADKVINLKNVSSVIVGS